HFGAAESTRAGSLSRKSTNPSCVRFWWVLLKWTQYGSAAGSGTFVPKPASWILHLNGLLPSQGLGGALARTGGASASAATVATAATSHAARLTSARCRASVPDTTMPCPSVR